MAASGGEIEALKILVEYGADIDEKTSRKNTPLIYAASRGHLDAVKWLAEKGDYVHSANSKGVTARSIAQVAGFKEIAAFLIRAEAMQVRKKHLDPQKLKKLASLEVPTFPQ
ncbi:MAG: ankyrin repeat domain-containing protein [Verrucomicrobiales bacterium]|nr:ankyrin repeat domain-containing protein [Verrucomicrobiales bacterium]